MARASKVRVVQTLSLLQDLVSLPGPAGQEGAVASYLKGLLDSMGVPSTSDAKGNLVVQLGSNPRPKVMVTAHMDEIAMIVRSVLPDGSLKVGALGGLFPWKIGEGPVMILATKGSLDGAMSFGSIHTADPTSNVRIADTKSLGWESVRILTGRTESELSDLGVRPGTRVVVHPSRRNLIHLGDLVGGFFLDDRADLVSWILAIKELKDSGVEALFVASAAEEVGGEGALFVMNELRPEVCIALELGPNVSDAKVSLNDQPTVWVTDSYSTMSAADGDLLAELGAGLGMKLQFQALSRGGSDASCAASHGLCGRPITLGLPMDNSHGFEVMHPGAMENLATLTVALLKKL